MTHAEASLVAPGGELAQLASESSKRIESTTGALHGARAFNTHLPERDRPLRGWQTPPPDPPPPPSGVEGARTVTRMAGVLNHAILFWVQDNGSEAAGRRRSVTVELPSLRNYRIPRR